MTFGEFMSFVSDEDYTRRKLLKYFSKAFYVFFFTFRTLKVFHARIDILHLSRMLFFFGTSVLFGNFLNKNGTSVKANIIN